MLDALTRLLPEAELVDIATGYFQVGAFPLLVPRRTPSGTGLCAGTSGGLHFI